MTLSIRDFEGDDAGPAARLFYDTVRTAPGSAYSDEQREAWAPAVPDTGRWRARLAAATTLVAEDERGLAGYLSLDASGHVDLAFVRSDRLRSGVGSALHAALLERARGAGLARLTADASLMARPFFERLGWRVVREQHPEPGGVRMTNYRMQLALDKGTR
jgi:putative acetyltransferase